MTRIGKKYALKRYDHFPIREVVCNFTRFLSHKNNEKSSSILLFYILLFMYSINIDDSMNRSLMINGETMEEMKIKFAKHQQIYKTNYELAESEIKRMDELYQDLIENVLKVLFNRVLIHTYANTYKYIGL